MITNSSGTGNQKNVSVVTGSLISFQTQSPENRVTTVETIAVNRASFLFLIKMTEWALKKINLSNIVM
jgi:hypothetical protein